MYSHKRNPSHNRGDKLFNLCLVRILVLRGRRSGSAIHAWLGWALHRTPKTLFSFSLKWIRSLPGQGLHLTGVALRPFHICQQIVMTCRRVFSRSLVFYTTKSLVAPCDLRWATFSQRGDGSASYSSMRFKLSDGFPLRSAQRSDSRSSSLCSSRLEAARSNVNVDGTSTAEYRFVGFDWAHNNVRVDPNTLTCKHSELLGTSCHLLWTRVASGP